MATVKKLKLKAPFVSFLKGLLVVVCILLAIFFYYSYQISIFTDLGYSRESSKFILFNGLKEYVIPLGENKTLNAAFESKDYKKEYLEKYQNIKFFEQKDFIKNINALIKKGYSNSNINMIFAHGNAEDVSEFAKRDKIKYIEEFFTIPYAKLKYYDRYIAYADETGEDEETTVLIVNLDLDKEQYVDAIEVNEYSTTMLVNKHRKLSEDFVPDDLSEIDEEYASEEGLQASKLAINAFIRMAKDAEKEGYLIYINSAYRSYQDQTNTCDVYRKLYGENYVKNYVAQPGFSEHQTGLSFDVASKNNKVFANSKEYEWMLENSYKYGFIHRFPKKYVSITGFNPEPWHFRYVGKKVAKYIYENKISFEEYYATFLDK